MVNYPTATADVTIVFVTTSTSCVTGQHGACACNCDSVAGALLALRRRELDLDDLTWLSAWIHDRSDESATKRAHARRPARIARGAKPLPRPRSTLPNPMRALPAAA